MSLHHKAKGPEAVGKTSFCDLPAELKILIISYVNLDPATFRSLSLLDRQTHCFLIKHELELVRKLVQNQNRMAGLLALPDRPTFRDYLTLQIEDRSMDAVFHTLRKDFLYIEWATLCVDSDDFENLEVLLLMLRAGFYTHFRAARLKSALEREDFIMKLSEEAWALLQRFTDFVLAAVRVVALTSRLKPLFKPSPSSADQPCQRDYDEVIDAVVGLALYSGMHVIDNFFCWRNSPEDDAMISDAGQWMAIFLTYNLEKSVLVKEDASFSYLDLLRHLCNIPTTQLARNDITVAGRSNNIRLREADFPGVTQASLIMIPLCPKLVVLSQGPDKSLGIELDRRQHRAASAVIRLTGLRAAAIASISKGSGFVKRLTELGVDNRSLARRHLGESTHFENLRKWNCGYTAAILGCSLFKKSRIGLVVPHVQAKSRQPTYPASRCPNCTGKDNSGIRKC